MSNNSEIKPNLISASGIKPASMELETVRKRLAEAKGPKYWRTLEELADQEAFGELLTREFPRQASEWVDPVSRRGFLKLAGASMALAGLAGCTRQPLEQILPYVRQPEELIPGKPIFYATAMPFHGHALPLLVETHEFRPTKIEGNPLHAASLGATDIFAQASILNLYDPDRSTTLTYKGELRSWGDFAIAVNSRINDKDGLKAKQGAGLRFLTGAMTSPTFGWQMKAVQKPSRNRSGIAGTRSIGIICAPDRSWLSAAITIRFTSLKMRRWSSRLMRTSSLESGSPALCAIRATSCADANCKTATR